MTICYLPQTADVGAPVTKPTCWLRLASLKERRAFCCWNYVRRLPSWASRRSSRQLVAAVATEGSVYVGVGLGVGFETLPDDAPVGTLPDGYSGQPGAVILEDKHDGGVYVDSRSASTLLTTEKVKWKRKESDLMSQIVRLNRCNS
ncbi:uncharacterized protein LOC144142939 [Haemaphysalis longicornis]